MPTEEKINVQEQAVGNTAASTPVITADPPTETVAAEEQISPEQLAYEQRFQEELEAHDRNILAALDEMLARQQQPQPKSRKSRPDENGLERFAIGMVRKGAGIVSLSLILIFMGIVVICCFFSPTPDYLLPMKMSPIAAVLLGIELLIYHVISGRKFRIHIPAICISAVIIAGCCTMAVVLNNSYTESMAEYDNRSIEAEIYERGYHELRHAADIAEIQVEVDLNPTGSARKSGIKSLAAGDDVTITVIFDGSYSSPAQFASECKTVIDGYRFLGIPVKDFRFICNDSFNSYRLDVNGAFMQDYTESELQAKVNHVYVEDYDYIEDLEDYIEATSESSESYQA